MSKLLQGHFCETHNTKYYRNEKAKGDGSVDVWYSHKKSDGTGFCVESQVSKVDGVKSVQQVLDGMTRQNTALVSVSKKMTDYSPASANGMFVCNAMNNAVNLASNGVIGVDEIGKYFNRILTELHKVA